MIATAYLVLFYDVKSGTKQGSIITSEPSPTSVATWAPIVVASFVRDTYGEASEALTRWTKENYDILRFRLPPNRG